MLADEEFVLSLREKCATYEFLNFATQERFRNEEYPEFLSSPDFWIEFLEYYDESDIEDIIDDYSDEHPALESEEVILSLVETTESYKFLKIMELDDIYENKSWIINNITENRVPEDAEDLRDILTELPYFMGDDSFILELVSKMDGKKIESVVDIYEVLRRYVNGEFCTERERDIYQDPLSLGKEFNVKLIDALIESKKKSNTLRQDEIINLSLMKVIQMPEEIADELSDMYDNENETLIEYLEDYYDDMTLSDMPSHAYYDVVNGGHPSTLELSAGMMQLLKEQGIECWLIATGEEEEFRAAVLYKDGEEFFVASPDDAREYSRNVLLTGNSSRIPLQEFANDRGAVKVIGSLEEKNVSLVDAIKNLDKMVIAEPRQEEYDISAGDLAKVSVKNKMSMEDMEESAKIMEVLNRCQEER